MKNLGVSRLTTSRLDTTNHSDRCLEAFHCSSAVNGSCPNGGHPKIFICRYYRYLKLIYLIFALINYATLRALGIYFNSLQIFQSIKVLMISSLYNRLILLSFCVKLKPIKKCYNISYIELKLRLFNHNAKF